MTTAVRPDAASSPPRPTPGSSGIADPVEQALAVLRWAGEHLRRRLRVTSSMADGLLAHLASTRVPGVDVVFLDTGYHFAETIGTRDWITSALPITLVNVTPPQTVAEQDAEFGAAAARPRPRPVLRAAQGRSRWRQALGRLRGVGLGRAPRRVADPRRHASSSTGTPSAAW